MFAYVIKIAFESRYMYFAQENGSEYQRTVKLISD